MDNPADFVAWITDKGNRWLININQIRYVDEVQQGHMRIWFSDTFSISINGVGADNLRAIILKRTLTLDGSRFDSPEAEMK
jgi:hypothetical protein